MTLAAKRGVDPFIIVDADISRGLVTLVTDSPEHFLRRVERRQAGISLPRQRRTPAPPGPHRRRATAYHRCGWPIDWLPQRDQCRRVTCPARLQRLAADAEATD